MNSICGDVRSLADSYVVAAAVAEAAIAAIDAHAEYSSVIFNLATTPERQPVPD